MKYNILLFSAVVFCAMGSLMSMEQQSGDQRLNFLLGHHGRIRKYSAENMGYAEQPSEFVGKKITHAVKLNESDRNAVQKALDDAAQKQATVTVPYTLDNKQFLATITPLMCMKNNKQRNNYFVKVVADNATH